MSLPSVPQINEFMGGYSVPSDYEPDYPFNFADSEGPHQVTTTQAPQSLLGPQMRAILASEPPQHCISVSQFEHLLQQYQEFKLQTEADIAMLKGQLQRQSESLQRTKNHQSNLQPFLCELRQGLQSLLERTGVIVHSPLTQGRRRDI